MSEKVVELNNSEQEAETQRVFERLKGVFEEELMGMARLMASKDNSQLLGQTEFERRDRVHRLGAKVLETAVNERQKKGRLRGC
jgi:hypothetical protein